MDLVIILVACLLLTFTCILAHVAQLKMNAALVGDVGFFSTTELKCMCLEIRNSGFILPNSYHQTLRTCIQCIENSIDQR